MPFFKKKKKKQPRVPRLGGKRNVKGLLKRRSLKKIKFPQQFCSTVVCECRNNVPVGKHCTQWFLGLNVGKPLRFSVVARRKQETVYGIQSMFRHRAMNANMSETSSITLAVGFPAPWPALVSTWIYARETAWEMLEFLTVRYAWIYVSG